MSKRKKPSSPEILISPDLGPGSYLLIQPTDPTLPLKSISPFTIHRFIGQALPEGIPFPNLKILRSGDIQIELTSTDQAPPLLALSSIRSHTTDIPLTVIPHPTLNFSRKVLRSREIAHCSADELLQELRPLNVIDVKKLTRDTSTRPTTAFLLVFATRHPPDHVLLLHQRFPLTPYYPSPLRCYRCQKYGHSAPCSHSAVCPNCAESHDGTHDEKNCTLPIKCAACDSPDHTVRSSVCPKYLSEQRAVRHSYREKITVPEARRALRHPPQANSYSAALQRSQPEIFPLLPPAPYLDTQYPTESITSQPAPSQPPFPSTCTTCDTILPAIHALSLQMTRLTEVMTTLLTHLVAPVPTTTVPTFPAGSHPSTTPCRDATLLAGTQQPTIPTATLQPVAPHNPPTTADTLALPLPTPPHQPPILLRISRSQHTHTSYTPPQTSTAAPHSTVPHSSSNTTT